MSLVESLKIKQISSKVVQFNKLIRLGGVDKGIILIDRLYNI